MYFIKRQIHLKEKLAGECIPKTLSTFNIDLPFSLSLSTVDQEIGSHCQGSRTPEATVTPVK